ncbi:MAG: ATP-dependent protease ATPase subunit HslU [Candidatus Bruticola sp.]
MSSDYPQNFDELFRKAVLEWAEHAQKESGSEKDKPIDFPKVLPEAMQDAIKQFGEQIRMLDENIKACEEAGSVNESAAGASTDSNFTPQFLFGADLQKVRQEMAKKGDKFEDKAEMANLNAENVSASLNIGNTDAESKKMADERSDKADSAKAEHKNCADASPSEVSQKESEVPETNRSCPDFSAYPLENLFNDGQDTENDRSDKINLDDQLTPRQVVEALDRYIVGQERAKKAVAVALRNRYRREKLHSELREEIIPKNILMVGPTGVGKTEIARRLAKLVGAPFLKVEATKYTEVGYVGRDVESMIRDLAMVGVRMIERERLGKVKYEARKAALERLLDGLQGREAKSSDAHHHIFDMFGNKSSKAKKSNLNSDLASLGRAELYERLYKGELNDRLVEVELEEESSQEVQVVTGDSEEIGVSFQDFFGSILPKKRSTHKLPVQRAFQMLESEEAKKLVDGDDIKRAAVELIENQAIVFLDELDKVADREGSSHGPDVSREGVQRDILPVVEGCSVNTKIGPIRTDHILFIAAGAFHETKPSDLIPELQGRFPIRVTLDNLKEEDFKRILTEPKNSLTRQYKELLSTEGIEVEFTDEAIDELASMACQVNEQNENIGARRLHTLLERVLEKISFEAPEMEKGPVVIDREYVLAELKDICQSRDLSRFIL